MTRNKMPRTRAGSVCYKLRHSFSPTANDFGPRLRTRRYTTYVNHFLDTSGDDDSNHVKPIRELRSSTKSLVPIKSNDHELDVWDSGRPKRTTCVKAKRISADERLVVDNRTYYKVEVMTNKLRSSGLPVRDPDGLLSRKIKSPSLISDDSTDGKNLVVKYKRSKNSQLIRLNNEAENFLFPRRDESSSESDGEVVEKAVVKVRKNTNNINNKICKIAPDEETSIDSISSETFVIKKKRRLTQAEAFILDNQRYYKFETPGSRLRYQGSYLPPITSKNNGEYATKQTKVKVPEENQKPKQLKLEDLKFSFEIVPETEQWYKTFQRQDKGEECYKCYNYNSGYHKPFILPYELGPLPPLDPSVCVCAYNRTKNQLIHENIPSTSATCTSYTSASSTDCNTSSTGEDTKSSEDSEYLEGLFQKTKYPIKRHRRVTGFNKTPRKSPRQHASTLAILSSLIHQRKRREIHKAKRNMDKHNLSTIAEETKEAPEIEPDYGALGKSIEKMLSNSSDDLSSLELSCDGIPFAVHSMPDIIETLGSYNNPVGTTKKCGAVVRKPWRKKKKNRTGWPNKNKRTVFRKNGNNGLGENGIKSKINNKSNNNYNRKNKNNVSKSSNYQGQSININKMNGDVQVNKLNGINDNFEVSFKNLVTPRRKEHRESSSDNCAEVVVASVGDKIDFVNVDLDKWENAERVLAAKIRNENINNDLHFQPIVRVQKLESDLALKCNKKPVPVTLQTRRTRPRRMPASPQSSRISKRTRGGWCRQTIN